MIEILKQHLLNCKSHSKMSHKPLCILILQFLFGTRSHGRLVVQITPSYFSQHFLLLQWSCSPSKWVLKRPLLGVGLQIVNFLISIQETFPAESKYLYLGSFGVLLLLTCCVYIAENDIWFTNSLSWRPGNSPSGATSIRWSQYVMAGKKSDLPSAALGACWQCDWCLLQPSLLTHKKRLWQRQS